MYRRIFGWGIALESVALHLNVCVGRFNYLENITPETISYNVIRHWHHRHYVARRVLILD